MPTKDSAPVFVHYLPLPLRRAGKKGIPWIVHTADGCFEAEHVRFRTPQGFETHEGKPPDQTCQCNIANHHLRGFGRLRMENNNVAIIEHEPGQRELSGAPAVQDSSELAQMRDTQMRVIAEKEELRQELASLRAEHESVLASMDAASGSQTVKSAAAVTSEEGVQQVAAASLPPLAGLSAESYFDACRQTLETAIGAAMSDVFDAQPADPLVGLVQALASRAGVIPLVPAQNADEAVQPMAGSGAVTRQALESQAGPEARVGHEEEPRSLPGPFAQAAQQAIAKAKVESDSTKEEEKPDSWSIATHH
jgi:hypothetical protein